MREVHLPMKFDLLSNLNPKQQEAVKHAEGPSVILAGAGSGKTRVLVYKVLYLIQEQLVRPESIVMITFTNKAAAEMKARITKSLGAIEKSPLGYVGTFHSFCAYILRRDGQHLGIENTFTIYDDNDQQSIIKNIMKSEDSKKLTPSYVLNRISAAKNQLISPERYLELFSDWNSSYIAAIYSKYEKELNKNIAVDFDDLIMKVNVLFMKFPDVLQKYQRRFSYFLVDEFQDTNYAQYVLTKQLGSQSHNVSVVGDFSQSIYSWRGADIRNLEKFKEDFPETEVFHLEQNYRSTQTILDFAYDVISKNQTHPILMLHTKNAKGEDVTYYQGENEEDEAIYIAQQIRRLKKDSPYSSFAVLYRTNAQSRVIEEAFLHYGLPYVLIGGTRFYERKEIKDVLSFLRLLVNPTDEVAAERIKKIGKRLWDRFKNGFSELSSRYKDLSTSEIMETVFAETGYLQLYKQDDPEDYSRLENIKELKSVAFTFPNVIEFLEQVALVESEYFEGERKSGKDHDGVRLMTLHQAKGLEFPYVFISGVEEGILPHSRAINDLFELEEERRLFYVGITRAQNKLFITYTKRRFIFGRRNETIKSRFIGEDDDRYMSSY